MNQIICCCVFKELIQSVKGAIAEGESFQNDIQLIRDQLEFS